MKKTIIKNDLKTHEDTISRGLATFVEVGNALASIREGKLYKESYATFAEYCKDRWEMSRPRAYQLIDGARVADNLSTIVDKIPAIESHARPLAKLPPEEQIETWKEVVDTAPDGKVTAAHVERVVKQKAKPKTASLKPKKKGTMNRTNDNIGWAAFSWNPVTGCLHNCEYCYARDFAERIYPQGFEPTFYPERLSMPENTKNIVPRWDGDIGYKNVFTCSMADLFGKWVPKEWIDAVIKTAVDNPQWNFLYLTKFPSRIGEFDYPDNVWLGVTIDRQHAVERAEKTFVELRASGWEGICWLSCEPMFERLTIKSLDIIDWVVIGGASKSNRTPAYRPPFGDIVHLYNQAQEAGTKIYMKTNLLGDLVKEYPIKALEDVD